MAARDLARATTTLVATAALALLAGCGAADHNDADVQFAQGMIPHHAQAVDMAEMALQKADDPAVKDLAEQVAAAQEPEIETMTGWLRDWDEEVPDADDHDHGSGDMAGMTGMMTSGDMDALAQASGGAFDRLWLEMMLEHHRGAVSESQDEVAYGKDPDAVELAVEIARSQTAEISRMEELLGQQ